MGTKNALKEMPKLVVPEFTIRADSALGIKAMIVLQALALSAGDPQAGEIKGKLRDFELYEEATRG